MTSQYLHYVLSQSLAFCEICGQLILPESEQSKGKLHMAYMSHFLSLEPCCSWEGCKALLGTHICLSLAEPRPPAGGSEHPQCLRRLCCRARPWVWFRTSAGRLLDSFAPSSPYPKHQVCADAQNEFQRYKLHVAFWEATMEEPCSH